MGNKKKILITAPFESAWADRLRDTFEVIVAPPLEQATPLGQGPHAKYLSEIAAVVCELDVVDEESLRMASNLELVVSCRAAPVNVDLAACERHEVSVATTPARNADVTAELTVGLILSTVRDFFRANSYIESKKWSTKDTYEPYRIFRGPSLVGKAIGVVGAGAIGRRVASRMKSFETEILFYDPFVDPKSIRDLGALVSLNELFERSDVITLHAPLMKETTNMIGREQLAKMKDGVFFVNVGRAGLVDQEALREVLESGKVARAGFDVFWEEPLPTEHWLFNLPNVSLLPHIAGASDDVIRMHSKLASEAILSKLT